MTLKEQLEDLKFEKLAGDFDFTEGPVWFSKEKYLVFSDVFVGKLYKWCEEEGVTLYREDSHKTDGNAIDREGRLISCEFASRSLTRREVDGTFSTLADKYHGGRLNSPNDVVVKSDGKIYFTDPRSGLKGDGGRIVIRPELPFAGVFRYDPETEDLELLSSSLVKPNGLAFSPDEKILYVADTILYRIVAFDVADDGRLENERVLTICQGADRSEVRKCSGPDGLKVDCEGNLYVAGDGNVIYVISPEGDHIAMIPSPNGDFPTNFTFGDDDLKTLYLCAEGDLYRVRMPIAGCPVHRI